MRVALLPGPLHRCMKQAATNRNDKVLYRPAWAAEVRACAWRARRKQLRFPSAGRTTSRRGRHTLKPSSSTACLTRCWCSTKRCHSR